MKSQITTELVKKGWIQAPKRLDHAYLVKRTVKTFRGDDFAHINPIVVCENGIHCLSASFISKGENALSLCHEYIKEQDDVAQKVKTFSDDVLAALSQAYSVRMAKFVDLQMMKT